MYEFEILDKTTGEHDFIYGYDWKDAIRRRRLEDKVAAQQIVCLYKEYID